LSPLSTLVRFWLFLAAVCTGCAGTAPRLSEAQVGRALARWPDATTEQLERGRERYMDTCSRCHTLHTPDEFPAERWPTLVDDMMRRARLARTDADEVVRYLVSAAEPIER
jgi:hypothetical protein